MRLIALQDFTYGPRPLSAGDEFVADSEVDAMMLKGFGKARSLTVEEEGTKRRGRYRRADMRVD